MGMIPQEDSSGNQRDKRLMDAGRRAVLKWLAHPAVQPFIEVWRPALAQAAAPLWQYLPDDDNEAVWHLLSHVCGFAVPDAQGNVPAPPPATWELTDEEVPQISHALTWTRWLIIRLAAALAEAGVPVDDRSPSVWFVVGQLALAVDWEQPASERFDYLQIVPTAGFEPATGVIRRSRHTSATEFKLIGDMAREWEARDGRPAIPTSAGGRPPGSKRTRVEIRVAYKRFVKETGCEPSLEELAHELGISERTLKRDFSDLNLKLSTLRQR